MVMLYMCVHVCHLLVNKISLVGNSEEFPTYEVARSHNVKTCKCVDASH